MNFLVFYQAETVPMQIVTQTISMLTPLGTTYPTFPPFLPPNFQIGWGQENLVFPSNPPSLDISPVPVLPEPSEVPELPAPLPENRNRRQRKQCVQK